jgi:rhodanese-related sulfurtransferase
MRVVRALIAPMLLAAILVSLALASSAGYTDVTADQAHQMLSSDPSIYLLDVRTTGEYENDGHIPGAYLIPNTELNLRSDELPMDKGGPILVYCRSGFRSSLASQDLVNLGYTDVRNMLGGFSTWAGMGYPTLMGSEQGTFPVSELSFIQATLVLLLPTLVMERLTRTGSRERTP